MEPNNENRDIIRAKNGDMEAFERLVVAHEKIVYNLALRLLKHEEDAKDMSQEAFLKAYRSLDKFDGKAAFSTWLYRVAYNVCIDELRRRKNKQTISLESETETEDGAYRREYADTAPTPEEHLLVQEEKTVLQEGIATLQEEYKSALILRDLQGLSYAEIAEIQDIALGTVKSRIARARQQLKEYILSRRELLSDNSRQIKGKEG